MPLHQAEAIILRTYALKESDKIVSFFTREFGKCRGVSRGARRPKSKFGASLEPLTHVRIRWFEKENRDLGSIDECEVVTSMMDAAGADYATSVGLSVIVEVAEKMLPDREPNDAIFRLTLLVLEEIRRGAAVWLPFSYDLFWMVRLGGFLPDLVRCAQCGQEVSVEAEVVFQPVLSGLRCRTCRPVGGQPLSPIARKLAMMMARRRLNEMEPEATEWARQAPDLRRFLVQQIEAHVETRLQSWPMLAPLEGELPEGIPATSRVS